MEAAMGAVDRLVETGADRLPDVGDMFLRDGGDERVHLSVAPPAARHRRAEVVGRAWGHRLGDRYDRCRLWWRCPDRRPLWWWRPSCRLNDRRQGGIVEHAAATACRCSGRGPSNLCRCGSDRWPSHRRNDWSGPARDDATAERRSKHAAIGEADDAAVVHHATATHHATAEAAHAATPATTHATPATHAAIAATHALRHGSLHAAHRFRRHLRRYVGTHAGWCRSSRIGIDRGKVERCRQRASRHEVVAVRHIVIAHGIVQTGDPRWRFRHRPLLAVPHVHEMLHLLHHRRVRPALERLGRRATLRRLTAHAHRACAATPAECIRHRAAATVALHLRHATLTFTGLLHLCGTAATFNATHHILLSQRDDAASGMLVCLRRVTYLPKLVVDLVRRKTVAE